MRKYMAMAIFGLALVLPAALEAQNYSINWYTIGGGGGSSSGTNGGSTYAVTGTIGQPATSSMSGGNYSLTAGFWSILSAVQTPGSPLITIVRSGSQATISWSASANGFILQKSSSLTPGSWSAASPNLSTNGGTISTSVPVTGGYQYFRLSYQ